MSQSLSPRRALERIGRRPAVVGCLGLLAGIGAVEIGLGVGAALLAQAAGLGLLALEARSRGLRTTADAAAPAEAVLQHVPARRWLSPRALHVLGLLLVLAGLGLLHATLRLARVPAGHVLARVPTSGSIAAAVSGTVLAVTPRSGTGPRVELELEALGPAPATGRVLLSLRHEPPQALLPGDRLDAQAKLRRIGPALLPGPWDRFESLASRGIRVEGFVSAPAQRTPGPAWSRWIGGLSRRLAAQLALARAPSWVRQERWDGQHGPFLAAILLGFRGELSAELAEVFRRSGLYHLFAISGMNLALIAAVLYGALGLALGRRSGAAASVVAILFYTALTAGQPSVWRASLMACVHLGGIVLGRRPDGLNSVALAAFVLLVAEPGLAADLGFQLTVLATASVLLYTRPLARQIRGPRAAALALATPVAAQAGILPLMLAHFRELSLFGLASGLLAALPFALALALAMLGAVLLGLGLDPASLPCSLALSAASVCAAAVFEVAELFATLPGATVVTPRLGGGGVALSFALLASFLLRASVRRGLLQGALVVLLAGAVFVSLLPRPDSWLRITFLAAGNADCALLELPGGRDVLIDGAGDPRGRFDAGSRLVVPFLWQAGLRHLETAYLSHAHPDHGLGLLAVLGAVSVDRVRLAGPIGREGLLHELARAARDGGTELELVNPYTHSRYALDENDRSLVLRVAWRRFSALFPGDVEAAAEHDLAATYGAALHSAVLKVPHHGSCTSSSEAFLDAVRPRLAVIPVGADNTFGHPCPGAVARLEAALGPQRVLRTSDGSVRVETDGANLRVERYAAGGWQALWREALE